MSLLSIVIDDSHQMSRDRWDWLIEVVSERAIALREPISIVDPERGVIGGFVPKEVEMSRSLYLIAEGEVTLITSDHPAVQPFGSGGELPSSGDWVVAFAASEREALELAKLYDAGQIQPDNVTLPDGRTVAALSR